MAQSKRKRSTGVPRRSAAARLGRMPEVRFSTSDLKRFGQRWQANGGNLTKAQPESSLQFGNLIDSTVANSLATMLGGIPVVQSTLPPHVTSEEDDMAHD